MGGGPVGPNVPIVNLDSGAAVVEGKCHMVAWGMLEASAGKCKAVCRCTIYQAAAVWAPQT